MFLIMTVTESSWKFYLKNEERKTNCGTVTMMLKRFVFTM